MGECIEEKLVYKISIEYYVELGIGELRSKISPLIHWTPTPMHDEIYMTQFNGQIKNLMIKATLHYVKNYIYHFNA